MTKLLLVILCALGGIACMPLQLNRPTFEITPTKSQDEITFDWKDETAYFDISSPSGIGGARIVRTTGNMPNKLLLRLHLKGLESFKFAYAQNEISVSVSSHGDNAIAEIARLNGATQEIELSPASEFWMPTEIVSQNKTIPLPGGHFQIELPRAFYTSGAREFSIEWIDFYR